MDTPLPPADGADGAAAAAPRRSPLIPDDQDEKAALALRVAAGWAANPQLTLLWKTPAVFATDAQALADALKLKNQTAAKRPQTTLALGEIDKQITAGLGYVKGYLAEKFTKQNAPAYYEEFGIRFYDDQHQLPRKQTERAAALVALVEALTTYGFGARDYGTAYWTPLRDGYTAATDAARASAQTVSKQVGAKNTVMDEVGDVLSALPLLIDANYRTETERAAKRREMGYLKEYN